MSDLKEKNPSETPGKPSGKSLEEWLEWLDRAHPYLSEIADHALDWYAVRKADSKDLGRVMEARKRRSGR